MTRTNPALGGFLFVMGRVISLHAREAGMRKRRAAFGSRWNRKARPTAESLEFSEYGRSQAIPRGTWFALIVMTGLAMWALVAAALF